MSKHDREPPTCSSSMPPPPDPLTRPSTRFPLMTPSASPPVQRPFGRKSFTPTPAKKRRVSRTPSLLGPGARSHSVFSASSSSTSPAFNIDASADPGPGEELHEARRASSFRVLDVWSRLGDKYARRLDEDDIVDLGKKTIIKDHGVLRSSINMFEIGHFADEHERAQRLDNGQPLTPVDDEPDELDAFADLHDNVSRSEVDGDEEDGLELSQRSKPLPPVREVDPADAADLAEFLKAEQERRVMFGDPDEDQEEEDEEEEFEKSNNDEECGWEEDEKEDNVLDQGDDESYDISATASNSDTERAGSGARESGNEEDAYEQGIYNDIYGNNRDDYSRVSTPSGSPELDIFDNSGVNEGSDDEVLLAASSSVNESPLVVSDEESEDELGGWDRDEGSVLYVVGDVDEGPSNLEDRDGLEGPSNSNPEPPPLPRKRGRKRQDVSDGISEPPSTQKVKGRLSIARKRSPTPILQLQTPPRSTSFGPEGRNAKVTSTYSRKGHGDSSSPRRAPMRIESTASESSGSEADELAISPHKSGIQKQTNSRSRQTYSPKTKLVPEVFIDGPSRTPSRKLTRAAPSFEDEDFDHTPELVDSPLPVKRRIDKGKGKAVDLDNCSYSHELEEERQRFSPLANNFSDTFLSPYAEERDSSGSQNRFTSSKKRRRSYSPIPEPSIQNSNTVDVMMVSPRRPSSRNPNRRSSHSRRQSLVTAADSSSYDGFEAGPSTQPTNRRRARSRHSEEQPIERQSRLHHPPELDSFNFTTPQHSFTGSQVYGSNNFTPSLPPQHPPAANFHDSAAQYHLAQALQSLSYLMGGSLPFPSPPVNGSHVPPFVQSPTQYGHQPWNPTTPRHLKRSASFHTPQSVATAPPTSSPIGSDYEEEERLSSSPTRRPVQERGRTQSQLHNSRRSRPKSAIRESRTSSRSRSLGRRVSFSSPEATHIEDQAYSYVSDDIVEVHSSGGEDSDFERRRQRRETQFSHSVRLQARPRDHSRAQTPGPPTRAPVVHSVEADFRHAMFNDSEPERAPANGSRIPRVSHRKSRREHR